MPTPTYDLIASTTLASSSSSVSFFGIPATWRDLVLVAEGITTGSRLATFIRLNGDTGANYSYIYAQGNSNNTTSSQADTAQTSLYFGLFPPNNGTEGRATNIYHLMDYSATNKHKTLISRYNISTITGMQAGRWASTSAITQIEYFLSSDAFAAGSTFNLYGIVSYSWRFN